MHFTQYYLDCLSQASYLIGDETSGEAVIVDPRRDVTEYLEDAHALGLRVVGVLNTHFHADFVSGHLELAQQTGAWIGYGAKAETDFAVRHFADGERLSLGDVTLEIMHTPGHTPESISVLVYEHADDEIAYAVLTGDALFIGDVGRPDLLASIGFTSEELGSMLYDTVQRKLMGLPDEVRVFPAHGAGSACGKNLSTERQSTIGEQRRTNYACQPMSEAAFLTLVTEGQPSAPEYFVFNATLNRQERAALEPGARAQELTLAQAQEAIAGGAVVLDARSAQDFSTAHLAGSVSVPADGRMAETVGMVLSPQDRVVIIADEGGAQEAAIRLARIGYDRVVGYVGDVEELFLAHESDVHLASRLTVAAAEQALASVAGLQLVDVRNAGEVAGGVIEGAIHIPLAELRRRTGELDPTRPVLAYCAGGWRSSVAASLLRAHGFADVSDLLGGYDAWQVAHGLVDAPCPTTLRQQQDVAAAV